MDRHPAYNEAVEGAFLGVPPRPVLLQVAPALVRGTPSTSTQRPVAPGGVPPKLVAQEGDAIPEGLHGKGAALDVLH